MIFIGLLIFFSLFLFGSTELWSFSLVQILICLISIFVLIKGFKEKKFSIFQFNFASLFLIILIIILIQIIPLPKNIVYSLNSEKKYLDNKIINSLETAKNNLSISNYWIKQLMEPSINELKENYFNKISLSPYRSRIALLKGISYFLIFISAFYLISDRRTASKLLIFISIMGFVAAIVGFINHFISPDKILWMREGKKTPFFAPFYNANNFAAYELIILPIIFGIIFSIQRGGKYFRTSKETKVPLLIVFSFFAIIIFIALFFSLSRAGIILSIVTFLFIIIVVRKIDKSSFIIWSSAIVSILLLIALIWLGFSPIKQEMSTLKKEIEFQGSLASRYQAWSRSITLLNNYWMIGSGASTFSLAFQKVAPFIPYRYERLHNDYLQFAIENGILPFLILLIIIFLFYKKVFNYWIELNSHTQKIILISLLTSVSLILIYSIFDFPLQIGSIVILFIVLLAAILSIGSNYSYHSNKARFSKFSALLYLVLVMIVLHYSVKTFIIDYKRIKIENAAESSLKEFNENEIKLFLLDSSSPAAYYIPGKHKLAACVKEVDEAISFNKAAKINIDTTWKLKLDTHLQGVIKLLLKALALEPMNSEYWVRLGQTLELLEWVKDLSTPVELEQLQHQIPIQMGELSRSAEIIYKTALELDPLSIDACHALGKLYYKNGKITESIKAFSICTKIRPWDDYFLKIIKNNS